MTQLLGPLRAAEVMADRRSEAGGRRKGQGETPPPADGRGKGGPAPVEPR